MKITRFKIKYLGFKMRIITFFLILFTFLSLILNLQSLIDTIPTAYADPTVSATILPRTADYQFTLARSGGGTTIGPGQKYTYEITYGAKQSATFPTTGTIITVSWGNNIAPNNTQMLEYVFDSATDGYNGAHPVIDTTNGTITWSIPPLQPGTTNLKLYFTLYSNGIYTGSQFVNATITATMQNQYLTMPDQLLTQTYTYTPPPPGPTPTAAPQPTPTVSITPTPVLRPYLQIRNLRITNISDNNTTFEVTTSEPSQVTVFYGTSPNAMPQTLSTDTYKLQNSITLPKLTANTTYYMKILFSNDYGQQSTSDIFTFRTAKPSILPVLDNNIIVVTADNTVLSSDTQKQSTSASPALILTINSNYEISYALTKQIPLKSIAAVIQNKILGATTVTASDLSPDLIIPMQEKEHNLYIANVKAIDAGSYSIYVRIVDMNGNIIEKKIADLKVIPHLTVYALDTGRPLADARVFLYYYDKQTHTYQPLSQTLFGTIANPSYTDYFGQSNIVLPPGNYRIEESAFLYDKATADFTIGPRSVQNFPVLYLKRDPFNLLSLASFVKDYLNDSWDKLVTTMEIYSSSIRIFHLVAVAILGSVIIVSFLLFTLRSQIKIRHVPIFFLFHLERILNTHRQKYLYGSVMDKDERPLSGVLIEIEDADTHTILAHTNTNKLGKFYLRNTFSNAVILLVTKEGFEPSTYEFVQEVPIPDSGILILLERGERYQMSFFTFLRFGFNYVLGLLFEMSLVISLILELLFLSIYGIEKTLIYFLLSIVNIILWLIYLDELKRIRFKK